MDFKEKQAYYIDRINAALGNYIFEKNLPQKTVYDAMQYSLNAGGKRLRPVLALAVADMLGSDINQVLPYACAIEMIHTYSLIHDDLPAMDNDDFRRGKPTNHKVFGEAMAILAGDGLLNSAFEVMLSSAAESSENLKSKIRAMEIIARASGVSGMIGGQVVDLESENKKIDRELLEYMHRSKTGALIKAPVIAAAVLCNAEDCEIESLNVFAEKIGLAFQIKDDILDVEGNDDIMGKKSGSDAENNKSTFVTIYGLEESKKILEDITGDAVDAIEKFGEKSWFLKNIAEYLLVREK